MGHVPTREIAIESITPSPENDRLYRPVDSNDPAIHDLAKSIRQNGVLEPLVASLDGFILSGHRRYVAAKLAGLKTVPVRYEQIRRSDDIDRFVGRLREHNRQRDKTRDEKLREELVTVDPEDAYFSLIEHREHAARIEPEAMNIVGSMKRSRLSPAKQPFLDAVRRVVFEEQRDFWPLSDRRIHYALLNYPPLRHASKPESVYDNTVRSYKSLCDLLTRARLEGHIPWNAIADETRPVTTWDVHRDSRGFVQRQLGDFLKGYWRDYQQSQPNHIEIVGEKNTIDPIIRPVAMQYCIPLTTGRGYCSLDPRYKMAHRFFRSGKNKLVLLMLSDFDPDGEEIAQSFARSMRDDFGIVKIHPIKVALIAKLVEQYDLPPKMTAKKTSANYRKFADQYGENVWELEALPPHTLQTVLREAVEAVLDMAAFNAELDAEKSDAAFLERVRRAVHSDLQRIDWETRR